MKWAKIISFSYYGEQVDGGAFLIPMSNHTNVWQTCSPFSAYLQFEAIACDDEIKLNYWEERIASQTLYFYVAMLLLLHWLSVTKETKSKTKQWSKRQGTAVPSIMLFSSVSNQASCHETLWQQFKMKFNVLIHLSIILWLVRVVRFIISHLVSIANF